MTIKRIVTIIMCVMLALTIVLTAVVIGKVSPVLNTLLGISDVTPPDQPSSGENEDKNQNQEQNQDQNQEQNQDQNQEQNQDQNQEQNQDQNQDQNDDNSNSETPHEHDYATLKQEVPATCDKTGHKILVCECGEEKVESIPALSHKYGVGKLIAPTCKEEGRTEFTCELCGYLDKRDVVSKLADHVWEKGKTHPATCTEDEYTEYACSCQGCDETKKEYGKKATGHIWKEVKVYPATCTEAGYTEYACSGQGCSETKKESGENALGHDEGEWEWSRDPVAGERGEEVKKCTRCQKVLDTRSQSMTMTVEKNESVYTVSLVSKNMADQDVVVFVYTITDEGALLSEESFVYTDVEGFSIICHVENEEPKVHSLDLGDCQITIDATGELVTPDAE